MNHAIRAAFAVPVVTIILGAGIASAHVVVKPAQVGVGTFQTFTTGVPNEKDLATVAVKVLIPDGLESVSPTVKQGWKIDVAKQGTGDDTRVTEISWTEGSIPTGQRDDFTFSARVPANETQLNWKAYQTYSDGSVVAWDGSGGGTPYSTTAVLNDLADSGTKGSAESGVALYISILALVISGISALLYLRK
jgi:uncharacterized protein YcnI